MTREEVLKDTDTRTLIRELQPPGCYGSESFAFGGFQFSEEELREELKLRPHVPNRNESRGLRMLRKKIGKPRKKGVQRKGRGV